MHNYVYFTSTVYIFASLAYQKPKIIAQNVHFSNELYENTYIVSTKLYEKQLRIDDFIAIFDCSLKIRIFDINNYLEVNKVLRKLDAEIKKRQVRNMSRHLLS